MLRYGLGIAMAGLLALSNVPSPAAAAAQTIESAASEKLQEMARDLPETEIRVLGQWETSPGWFLLQKPFWTEIVPKLSDGKIKPEISSLTKLNIKGPEAFRLMKVGTTDILDITANYFAGEVPELDGMDLPGAAPDIELVARAIDAYTPVLKEQTKKLGAVALGFGPSVAQVTWCNGEVDGINDFQGRKIRVYSAAMADLVVGLGGVPVTMSFSEVPAALQRKTVDCAITGSLSGNSAKLFEVTTHMYPLPIGWASWISAANEKWWAATDPKVRDWLQLAIDTVYKPLSLRVWKEATNQGVWCSTGDERCTWGTDEQVTPANLTLSKVGDADRAELAKAVETQVLPKFAKACGRDCAIRWNEAVGAVIGLRAPVD